LSEVASTIPPNFTGADFSALTSEAYMIAVKRRIDEVNQEIIEWCKDNSDYKADELLPETFFRLKYAGDAEKEKQACQVVVTE